MFCCLHTFHSIVYISCFLGLQVPDRDFAFYVGLSGHWPRHLPVCGGSSLVST